MIEIKTIHNHPRFSTPINEGCLHRKKLMDEDYIQLSFSIAQRIAFERGDYTTWQGVRYELTDFVYPTHNTTTGGYDYQLRLDAYYWKWKNKQFFFDRAHNPEASWHLTRTPDAHLSVVCSNLEALGYLYNGKKFTYAIDASVDMSAKPISYSQTNIIDALNQIAETWEAEWWVEDDIIHLGRCEYNTAIEVELDRNVTSMSRSDSKDNYATRIYAFGSTRNLPINYRDTEGVVVEGVVQKRLMLPAGTPYIDAFPGMTQEEAVEAIVIFEDVYPRRIGTMSHITTKEYQDVIENEDGSKTVKVWNAYRYKDTGITFSEKHRLEGQELHIVFSSGVLNGMDFIVAFNPEAEDEKYPTAQLWEIIRNEDYGTPLPNDTLKPEEGDTYILYGFDTSFVSSAYLPAAEQELKDRAVRHVGKSKEDPSVYECVMDIGHVVHNDIDLNIGDRVKLLNPNFFDANGRQSRIYGFEKHLDGSHISYTVGNTSKYSRLAQVENEIKEIIYQGNVYSGSGGGVYVIGRHDRTTATDRNVFSATRSIAEFLSKTKDDNAQGLIKLLQGAHFGNFVDSMSAGMGAGIMPDGRAQVESLEVRGYMKVMELIYNRLSAMEGDFVFTESGTTENIEKIDASTYRLTIRKRWEHDFTAFKEGDVIRGIVNNLSAGNTYYTAWSRVLSVNTTTNSITVSVYPDQEVPAGANYPPTELMVLQRWGNTVDTARQSTWYMSSSEGRIVWLTGVTKPILEESNYGSFYGKPIHLSIFEGKPMDYNAPYLYVKGLAVQNLIRVDYLGNPVKDFRDRGPWQIHPEEPYRNTSTFQDDVWHAGAKWRCLTDNTSQEPAWNATGWQLIEGNKDITCQLYPTNGEYFYADAVDFILHWDVKYGYMIINNDIQKGDVEWTRDTGDVMADNLWAIHHAGANNDLHITNTDTGYDFDHRGATFKVKIFVRDGQNVIPLEEEFKV